MNRPLAALIFAAVAALIATRWVPVVLDLKYFVAFAICYGALRCWVAPLDGLARRERPDEEEL